MSREISFTRERLTSNETGIYFVHQVEATLEEGGDVDVEVGPKADNGDLA